MRSIDVAGTALSNTLRSKLRTFLTVVAIVIGAFTLTLTSGLGAGVNQYVTKMVSGFGDSNQLYVMSASPVAGAPTGDGPVEYDPETSGGGASMMGASTLSDEDIETIASIDGITDVEPVVFVNASYLEAPDGDQYAVDSLGMPSEAAAVELAAGELPAPDTAEITVPESWVEALGAGSADDAVGLDVRVGIANAVGEMEEFAATVSGVSLQAVSGAGGAPMPSQSLNDDLYEYQNSGLAVDRPESYIQAVADVEDLAADGERIKQELTEHQMLGLTLEDQLGAIQGVINAVTWVLNGFALIALLAASFGIVNTLLMSVQERTREIGLMKALGMSGGRVFGLFSSEAVMIGLMGSVIGIGLGVATGVVGNQLLVTGPLKDVAGLSLYAVDPLGLLLIALLILAIAFLAGTLPALRAAKKDPIEALRYE
ncbi:ABC transporter permease [Zhihengliuella sp.]|uniref:ABC transporter permease n=1 Tax=Zhihengliuella sp. TaxID=1954483 RepID=UPI0028122B58|nr:ABC transporter permease [Zhihengliuella sp.]